MAGWERVIGQEWRGLYLSNCGDVFQIAIVRILKDVIMQPSAAIVNISLITR